MKQGVLFLMSCLLPAVFGAASCGCGCQSPPQTNPPSCQCNCLPPSGSGVLGDPCPTSSILNCGYNYALNDTTPLPYTVQQRAPFSPFYQQVVGTTIDQVIGANSICDSYFVLTNSDLFLLVRTYVYNNGTVSYNSYFISDLPGTPGCYRITGEILNEGPNTVVYNDCSYNIACTSTSKIFSVFRRYLFQTGNSVSDILFLLALAEIPYPPQECIDETVAYYQGLGFNVTQLPYSLPYQCVTEVNGLKCINYKSVSRTHSIRIKIDL